MEQQKEELLIFKIESSNLATIKLNRPKALNAMNQEMNIQFNNIINNLSHNIKYIIIEGEGRAFSAGADIKAMFNQLLNNKDDLSKGYNNIDQILHDEYSLYHNFAIKQKQQQFSAIAIMNGITMGGASGVSIYNKYRIVTENTMYAMPETKIGFFCDVTSSIYYSQLRNNLGFYYALTGKKLNGLEMISVGLADYYVESKNLENLKNELIQFTQQSNNKIEDIFQKYSKQFSEQELKLDYDEQEINNYFQSDTYDLFIEKLKSSNTKLSQEIQEQLSQQCPLSLIITFNLYKKYLNYENITEAYILDFKIAHWMIQQSEFYEGTRCVLVDKQDKPKYKFANINEIPQQIIDNIFKQDFPAEENFKKTLQQQLHLK